MARGVDGQSASDQSLNVAGVVLDHGVGEGFLCGCLFRLNITYGGGVGDYACFGGAFNDGDNYVIWGVGEVAAGIGEPNGGFCLINNVTVATFVTETGVLDDGEWHSFICGRGIGGTVISVFDGQAIRTGGASNLAFGGTPVSFEIGAYNAAGSPVRHIDGDVANHWSYKFTTAPTGAQIEELGREMLHRQVKAGDVGIPDFTEGYIIPLWGVDSPELDISGLGNHATLTNSPTQEDHPPQRPPFGFDIPGPLAKVISVSVGIALEADTVFGVTILKTAHVGLAGEVDTALGLSVSKAKAVGLSLETDTAFGLFVAKEVALGLASEVDTAVAIVALKNLLLGLATETDTAFAVSVTTGIVVGLAAETDTALALSAQKLVAIGLATETDTALAIRVIKAALLGLATETDTALAMAISKALLLSLAIETDTALPVIVAGATLVGLATETDTALAASIRKLVVVGLAAELDTALTVVAEKIGSLGLASETDSATVLTHVRNLLAGLALETDSAFSVISVGGQVIRALTIICVAEDYAVTVLTKEAITLDQLAVSVTLTTTVSQRVNVALAPLPLEVES